jgi:hypothetical protein
MGADDLVYQFDSQKQSLVLVGDKLRESLTVVDRTRERGTVETIVQLSSRQFEQRFANGAHVAFGFRDVSIGVVREPRPLFKGYQGTVLYCDQDPAVILTIGTNHECSKARKDIAALRALYSHETGRYLFWVEGSLPKSCE